MKYLVFGHKGQLGREFCKEFEKNDIEYKGYDIDGIDIADTGQVLAAVASFKPNVIINCAAYNLVDAAETNTKAAFSVNAGAVKNIALAANRIGAEIVHYGTDYVFDGTKGSPYVESDKPNPLNKYGESKRAGEIYLEETAENFLLLRLSWVYGAGKQNFIYKLRQWAEKQDKLEIADDEISVPTSTETIVDITLAALKHNLKGLYHLTNSEYASRYEWASEILKYLKIEKEIIPVSKDIFDLPAKRPGFSAMSNKKISTELDISIPAWQDALKDFISLNIA